MKNPLGIILFGLVLAGLSACSSPDNRIKDHQAAFNALSPEDQGKIRGGRVDINFTPEMVEMSLGEPDRRYVRTTGQGSSEVWAYHDHGGSFSFGIGVGGRGTAVGLGVGSGGDRRDDKARIIFANGRVIAIERRGS